MAKPRRKKRTSIRTAAGVAQEKFLDRVREAVQDPLAMLPTCSGPEPKAIAKTRAGLERAIAGKPNFFDKRDKGVVGAIYQSKAIAQLEAVPRLLDTKIGGKRRFFLQRGHVSRAAMLGVHNHDEPRALLMAYRDMAKKEGLHFFACPGLVCSGKTPTPPDGWVEALAAEAGLEATKTDDGWRLGPAGDAVRLRLRGGPAIDVAAGRRADSIHKTLTTRYAGPRQRHPVEVSVIVDGVEKDADREALAGYRGGIQDEKGVVDASR